MLIPFFPFITFADVRSAAEDNLGKIKQKQEGWELGSKMKRRKESDRGKDETSKFPDFLATPF